MIKFRYRFVIKNGQGKRIYGIGWCQHRTTRTAAETIASRHRALAYRSVAARKINCIGSGQSPDDHEPARTSR